MSNTNESVLDLPHDELAPTIWEQEGDRWVMKKEIVAAIERRLSLVQGLVEGRGEEWPPGGPARLLLIGSAGSFQWTPDADVDINVMIEPGWSSESGNTASTKLKPLREAAAETNGAEIPGTRHPLNLFFTDTENRNHLVADNLYSIPDQLWEREPEPGFAVDPWDLPAAQALAAAADRELGELRRAAAEIRDVLEFCSEEGEGDCAPGDLSEERSRKAAAQADRALAALRGLYDLAHAARDRAFRVAAKRGEGTPNRDPSNLAWKFLERNGYTPWLRDAAALQGNWTVETLTNFADHAFDFAVDR